MGGCTGPPPDPSEQGCFLPNFGLRLNFAIADYLFETFLFDNITSHGDQEVAEAGRRQFSQEKAQKWRKPGKKLFVMRCSSPLTWTLRGLLNICMYQFNVYSLFT